MTELTQDLLKELFDYQDGNLYWKVSKAHCVKIGDRAGTVRKDGYRSIQINGKLYLAHRLIFLYHHGYLPETLDHIDRNPANNDINNLREVTNQENCRNQKKTKFVNGEPTSSDYTGVYWNKRMKKWHAQITIAGKKKHLGYYDSEIEAAEAYKRAAVKYFGNIVKLNDV